MKKHKLIFIFTIIFFCSCYNFNNLATDQPITIKPGIGIDNIVLNISSQDDILKYRNLKYNKTIGGSITCGVGDSEIREGISYKSESGGILFQFTIDYSEKEGRPSNQNFILTRIVVEDSGALFLNGLKIRQSSINQVVNKLGNGERFENTISYDKLGLFLVFSKDSILERVDLKASK